MILPNKIDHQSPSCPFLSSQGSLYNLTLDHEINNQLGNGRKPLNTMDLNELVKNVIASDQESQLMQNPTSSSSSSCSSASAANVQLNQAISKKTIDEVWSEIVDQECGNVASNSTSGRQLTLGETTLEEFLIRAGVLSLGNQENITNPRPLSLFDPMILVKQQGSPDWLQFQMEPGGNDDQNHQANITMPIQAGKESHFQVSNVGFENQALDVMNYMDNHLELPVGLQDANATPSDPNSGVERKRRYAEEMMEKSIQRRQRRMIKNRESAARSRARKQAYTKQLEQNVSQLKTTNFWLKRQKEVEMLLDSNPISEPRHQLRRTSSSLF